MRATRVQERASYELGSMEDAEPEVHLVVSAPNPQAEVRPASRGSHKQTACSIIVDFEQLQSINSCFMCNLPLALGIHGSSTFGWGFNQPQSM